MRGQHGPASGYNCERKPVQLELMSGYSIVFSSAAVNKRDHGSTCHFCPN